MMHEDFGGAQHVKVTRRRVMDHHQEQHAIRIVTSGSPAASMGTHSIHFGSPPPRRTAGSIQMSQSSRDQNILAAFPPGSEIVGGGTRISGAPMLASRSTPAPIGELRAYTLALMARECLQMYAYVHR